jgi:hypothetical protein
LERSRQRDSLIDLDCGFGANILRDLKKTLCVGLFAGNLNDPIFLGGTAAYDAIFEKNICHGVSGNPAQKKIVMLGGHLDHYLHEERFTAKSRERQYDSWKKDGPIKALILIFPKCHCAEGFGQCVRVNFQE